LIALTGEATQYFLTFARPSASSACEAAPTASRRPIVEQRVARAPLLPTGLGHPDPSHPGRVILGCKQAHGRRALGCELRNEIAAKRYVPLGRFLDEKSKAGGARLAVERWQRGIALELNGKNLREELRQAALPQRVLGVRDEDETAARPKRSSALRKEAGEVINVMDHVDGEHEVAGTIADGECSGSISDEIVGPRRSRRGFPKHGRGDVESGVDDVYPPLGKSANVNFPYRIRCR